MNISQKNIRAVDISLRANKYALKNIIHYGSWSFILLVLATITPSFLEYFALFISKNIPSILYKTAILEKETLSMLGEEVYAILNHIYEMFSLLGKIGFAQFYAAPIIMAVIRNIILNEKRKKFLFSYIQEKYFLKSLYAIFIIKILIVASFLFLKTFLTYAEITSEYSIIITVMIFILAALFLTQFVFWVPLLILGKARSALEENFKLTAKNFSTLIKIFAFFAGPLLILLMCCETLVNALAMVLGDSGPIASALLEDFSLALKVCLTSYLSVIFTAFAYQAITAHKTSE